ncbi:MAG TPA: ABC transporter permease [bacterium]|jgi:ABC-type antimicrobial peptide transport system permease subunit|nr:ABC transporter permease [bacterium]HNZ51093.1 ABC transporter permease [bacterium]HOF79851.1 ABC transporter permease [bacterium]HOH85359.1 ABC transporter permease [bacterium]HOQ91652.1 ABC transporter permease [bacterium]
MMLTDLVKETILAVTANKTRTSLTMLGIVIGIGSVIAMVAVGQGAQKSIEESIQSIGSNLLMVQPGPVRSAGVSAGRGNAKTLTIGDAEAIGSQIAKVKAVSPELSSRYQVTAKGQNTNTQIIGVTADYASVRSLEIDLGSFIRSKDSLSASKVAVLAPTTRDDLFGTSTNPVGQTISINKINFTVIGVTKAKGGSGFNNQDDSIFVPLKTAQLYLSGNEYLSTISIQADSQDVLTEVQNQVSQLLLARHKITDSTKADFQIMNQADIVETASSVAGTFTALLAAIAGISLLVGGIGIMNMMLTTVTERTREIGLRKSIGAKRRDISQQFLAEAVLLTFLGGAIGIVFGWLTSLAIAKFANTATSISGSSVLLAFAVSAAIGIIFGYYPAQRAAKLNPIDALRYE